MAEIIDEIEGKKFWGYAAMGAIAIAGIGIALVVKETMDAKKAAKSKDIAKANLEDTKVEVGIVPTEGEPASECGGCSGASGRTYSRPSVRSSWIPVE